MTTTNINKITQPVQIHFFDKKTPWLDEHDKNLFLRHNQNQNIDPQ